MSCIKKFQIFFHGATTRTPFSDTGSLWAPGPTVISVNSAFHPSGVGKLSTSLSGWG